MSVRWTKKVARGLGHIFSLADCELTNHELTEMKCACHACSGEIESEEYEGAYDMDAPCQCTEKPFEKQCEGCRTTIEWATALVWIEDQIRKHKI
jgi:hypothetical protein